MHYFHFTENTSTLRYVTVTKFEYQSSSDNTVYAYWSFSEDNVDHYTVQWYYDTGDGTWFDGGSSDVTLKNATHSVEDGAYRVRVDITPVSTTYTSWGVELSYWTGKRIKAVMYTSLGTPETPSAPTVTVEDYTLTASLSNISDSYTKEVQFYVYKNNTSKYKTGRRSVTYGYASFSCSIAAGNTYTVRCRGYNSSKEVYGEWSEYSSEVSSVPEAPTISTCAADSETSIKLTWSEMTSATGYTVEYATSKTYFDSSSEVSSLSVTSTTAYVTGLDSGYTYYFRLNATNDNGASEWSSIKSTVLGTTPSAPTTWSSSTTAMVGNSVTLYWVHNTEDNSSQTKANVYMTIDGSVTTKTFTYSDDDDEEVSSYTLDLSGYTAGATITWKVRTAGITGEYSEWSIQRTINVYDPPTLSLEMTDILESLPLSIVATAEPSSQTPTGYQITITAESSYETVDATGTSVYIYAGSEVYSKYFASSDADFSLDISAGDITLENGETYALTMTVAMDSGLTAEATSEFEVSWDDAAYNPDAGIAVDYDSLTCYVSPFCYDEYEVLVENVTLSVYRREFDGALTKLATGLENNGYITITDPHPALDYARYRIVAVDTSTGAVSYSDLPGQPIKEPSIVLQWDEDWTEFDFDEETEATEPPWTGSMVKIPYNIDISESHEKDVSLIEYIGREHPVSYYGTQQGYSASWSCEIPKTDKETIYALRRLSRYNGDVYVREPTGTGYWAQISVSMNINHCELTVPISLDLTRVEGGE